MDGRARAVAGLLAGAMACGTAQASGVATWRVGVLGGSYGYEQTFTDTAGAIGPAGTEYETTEDSSNFGILLGVGAAGERFFGDLGLELVQVPDVFGADFNRTDLLLTGGVFIGDHWTLFGGVRSAWHGKDQFGSDAGYTESGPFLGGGYSRRVGERWSLAGSVAVNFLTFKDEGGQQVDDATGAGFSFKVQANRLESPHSFFMRLQSFGGTQTQAAFEFEYQETYFQLGYQATFDILSW